MSTTEKPPAQINVPNVALVFEGGGMRAAHTSAVVATLLNNGIIFPHVSGISAGSSNTVNYISRDPDRAKRSFVEFGDDPRFGGWHTWLRGKGWFNADYIYGHTWQKDGPLPFDDETFFASPVQFRIGGFDCEVGETHYWGRDEIRTTADLMRRVRASSSIPLVMPQVEIDGHRWLDGALGSSGGIPVDAARADGYTRFFVVLTRPRDYIKKPMPHPSWFRWWYRKQPAAAEGILARPANYNRVRDELLDMESQGQAYLYFPERMAITNHTHNVPALQQAWDDGMAQSARELPAWKDFLGLV